MTTKLTCYVDESGQDTYGDLFFVGVVITSNLREQLSFALEKIEHESKKQKVKWVKARHDYQIAYIKALLAHPAFIDTLTYAHYTETTDYFNLTVQATAAAILNTVDTDHKATVFVDGLPKSQIHPFSAGLRAYGVRVQKVRGVRKEESDCLVRLADSVCGFTRGALAGRSDLIPLFEQALQTGYLRQLE